MKNISYNDLLIKNKTKLIETKLSNISIKNKVILCYFNENSMPFSLKIYTPVVFP